MFNFEYLNLNVGFVLRIDKGSRAVRHIISCSGGTISGTATIYIPHERPHFSPSFDIG